jgi:hypothetical protein
LNRFLIAAMCTALGAAGCATSTATYGPSGKAAHSINCNGGANSWGSCYEKAGSLCGAAGYDVVVQNGSVTPFGVANGYANASGASFSGFSGGLVSRNILVQCKTPA